MKKVKFIIIPVIAVIFLIGLLFTIKGFQSFSYGIETKKWPSIKGTIIHNGEKGYRRQDDEKINKCLKTIYFIDFNKGWAAGSLSNQEETFLYTEDGGNKWVFQNCFCEENINDIHFTDDLYGWAGGDNGTLLHTQDGGKNWKLVKIKK
jgi:photosystem II stability/assembly factor-like uncharacterized protein